MNPYLIIAALLLAAATGAQGYRMGSAANEARHTAADLAQAEARAAAQSRILAAEQTARLLNQALEDQAYAEPDLAPACLPASRVMRLNRYVAP